MSTPEEPVFSKETTRKLKKAISIEQGDLRALAKEHLDAAELLRVLALELAEDDVAIGALKHAVTVLMNIGAVVAVERHTPAKVAKLSVGVELTREFSFESDPYEEAEPPEEEAAEVKPVPVAEAPAVLEPGSSLPEDAPTYVDKLDGTVYRFRGVWSPDVYYCIGDTVAWTKSHKKPSLFFILQYDHTYEDVSPSGLNPIDGEEWGAIGPLVAQRLEKAFGFKLTECNRILREREAAAPKTGKRGRKPGAARAKGAKQ